MVQEAKKLPWQEYDNQIESYLKENQKLFYQAVKTINEGKQQKCNIIKYQKQKNITRKKSRRTLYV